MNLFRFALSTEWGKYCDSLVELGGVMRLLNKESKAVYEKNVRIYQSITARDIVATPLEGTLENLESLLNSKTFISKQIACHIDIHSNIAPLI